MAHSDYMEYPSGPELIHLAGIGVAIVQFTMSRLNEWSPADR